MGAGTAAEAAVRRAVRTGLVEPAETPADEGGSPLVLAAVSGGADSLALAGALAREAGAAGVRAGAVVVDHELQAGSAAVADRAAEQCRSLGLAPVEVVPAVVAPGGDGPEAAAREARYAALDQVAATRGAATVLLGHTRDDQAEQVLLGLARGAGARSLAGMPAARGRYRRPLLRLTRATTTAACTAFGLEPWTDPMNADPRYARVRARTALADLEEALGPGLPDALARSADLLRADADLLDVLAAEAVAALREPPGRPDGVPVADLAALPPALRSRALRTLLLDAGAPPGRLTAGQVAEVDRLLTDWHGQGPLHLAGPLEVSRRDGRLRLRPLPLSRGARPPVR